MVFMRILIVFLSLLFTWQAAYANRHDCPSKLFKLQVLGSGGPEIDDGRASSAYLLWIHNRAQLLVDFGSGASLNYEKTSANFNDLNAILLTHLHVDHSADLPALFKGAYFIGRKTPLLIYGPEGNDWMPSVSDFIHSLFSAASGSYRYLSDIMDSHSDFRLIVHTVHADRYRIQSFQLSPSISLSTITVHHGPIPALAWRIDIGYCAITFSGDMNNDYHTLARLAAHSDILVVDHAIVENTEGIARDLHMPPSQIGLIAHRAHVKKLVLSHRMKRTFGYEMDTLNHIKQYYTGPVFFADDLDIFTP